jgi:6-phosphofructo-2-kinase/fructose-2,6-biphosphatase
VYDLLCRTPAQSLPAFFVPSCYFFFDQPIKCKKYVEWRALREIEVGICDGLTYEQVKMKFPEEYRAREQDKLRYRYPRGESYLDIIARLEPVILELERQEDPLLIIGHQAVLRCLYAYFLDLPPEEVPYLSIPLHTLIMLDRQVIYGAKERRTKILVEDDPEENA